MYKQLMRFLAQTTGTRFVLLISIFFMLTGSTHAATLFSDNFNYIDAFTNHG